MIDYPLLLAVAAGIVLLLFLILYLKIQAFLSLLISSIAVGLLAGLPAADILNSMRKGMGETLGFVATVVGLGALFGALLEHSGGAQALAAHLLSKAGTKRAPWAMVLTGFVVAIPVFFDVAFIILVPVVYALQKKTGKSLLLFGIPLLAGLAITHSFIPPTPGPVAVADIIGADLGWVIVMGFIAGIPAALVSGPVFARYISKKIQVEVPAYIEIPQEQPGPMPSPALIASIIAVPIVLMVFNTVMTGPLMKGVNLPYAFTETLALIGHPFAALIIANLLAWYVLGIKRGVSQEKIHDIWARSLAPAGLIILLTGAGGVFKQVLIETGAGTMLAGSLGGSGTSPLIFAFLTAAIIRVLQGSSTVAMITSAGLTSPLLASSNYSDPQMALLVIAIASGATILSHVNDSGFWLVNRYFGMTEKETFRSWTVMETLIALTGFGVVLVLNFILRL